MESISKYRRKLSKSEINALPLERYDGPTHVVRTVDELPPALDAIRSAGLLGFDTETRPSFHKGQHFLPALMQLATADAVYLFQLRHLGLPQELRDVLEAPTIPKAGVAVADDIKGLQEIAPFTADGFVDLGDLAHDLAIPTRGLRNLTANLFGFRISKGAQRSNWSADTLTAKQIGYAAMDAWISRRIYLRLKELVPNACPPPSNP